MSLPRHDPHRRAPLLLAGLVIALAAVVAAELLQEAAFPDDRPAAATRAADPAAATDPGFSMPPLRSFAEVTARPLFSPTRRPPAEDAAVAAVNAASLTLVGVVIAGADRHALIAHGQPPRLDRVAEGQRIEGWTVETIEADRLVLRNGDRQMEVKAKDKPAPSPPARPARGPRASAN